MTDVDSVRPLGAWLSYVESKRQMGEPLHVLEQAAFDAGKEWLAFVSGEPYRTVKP
jgi:hypothetical protein